MKNINIGIVGYGVIGKAVDNMFNNTKCELHIYDPNVKLYNDMINDTKNINNCECVFVCVPTPHREYYGLNMSYVEDVISKFSPKIFIICSALQPGTTDHLSKKYNKRIVVQPEYFGETVNHPLVSLSQQQFLIFGGVDKDVNDVIKMYQNVYNANIRIRKVTALEAEVIKLSENRAIAYKVAQCQELYDACQAAGIDYETIRQAVYGDDPRFNLWWTWVYEGNRGFNSKCIPKDVYGWHKWAKESGIEPDLTYALLETNKLFIKR